MFSRAASRASATSPTRFFSLLSAALIAAICHIAFDLSNNLSNPSIGFVIILIGAIVYAFLAFRYIGSVFAFWKVQDAPSLKPFVYQLRCAIFIGSALILFLLPIEYPIKVIALYFAGTFLIAGLYDLYIVAQTWEHQQSSRAVEEEAEADSDVLDTGALGKEEDMENMKLHHPRLPDKPEISSFFLGRKATKPVFSPQGVHVITYGEPGSGKGINAVIPNLMHWRGSAFVTDPKGELAATTAQYRRDVLGQKIVYLNPWQLHGLPNTVYNPLQIILDDLAMSRRSRGAAALKHREIADAEALSNIILPEPPGNSGDTNKWVRDDGRRMLKAFILYLAVAHKGMCDLVMLRTLLSLNDDDYANLLIDIKSSDEFGGELAREGDVLFNSFVETRPQHEYARNEAQKSVNLYDGYGHLGRSVQGSELNMKQFVRQPTTIYLMIPKEYKISHASWMSLIVMNAFEAIGRNGDRNSPVLCMLDEFANLGKLPTVTKALAEYRGNGLRAWLIVQNRRQLQSVYGENEARALEELCNVEQILGVKYEQAEELSRRIGEQTIRVESIGDLGPQFDDTYRRGRRNVSLQAKRILPASEITDLGDKQLIFIDSKPFLIEKCPFWFVDPWRSNVTDNPLEGPAPSVRADKIIRLT